MDASVLLQGSGRRPDPKDRGETDVQNPSLLRSMAAEALGTGFLPIATVGSGILGERLSGGNVAITLLVNTLATSAALFALIEWFAPISGAHFNPLVTLVLAFRRDVAPRTATLYVPIQILGAIAGVGIANTMFDAPIYALSSHVRSGLSQWLSEAVVTFGLIGAVWVCSRLRPAAIAGVVSTYFGSAFWFTATDFAIPAVTIARALTDTFAGIRPIDIPALSSPRSLAPPRQSWCSAGLRLPVNGGAMAAFA